MRLLRVVLYGFRGHPLHPPLTDVSIGAYTVATIAVVLGWAGWKEELMAGAGFVALIVGLGAALPTAVTGLADFLKIPSDSGARRTGWLHLAIMVTATVLFALTAVLLHPGYLDERVPSGAAITMIIAFVVLTAGGWVGGSLAYVHGVRVLGREDASLAEAVTPSLPELDTPPGRR